MLDRARPIGAPDSRSARTTASADERSASGADAGVFPAVRLRRNRKSAWARAMVAENRLTPNDLIWPLFVTAGKAVSEPVASMPGVSRLSVDNIVKAAREAADLGIPVVSIFPFTDPKLRSDDGKEAVNQDNLVCCAVRAIRDAGIEIGVLCDVALDPYTSHGHDGLLIDGRIENDATVEVLQHQALIQAEAGCDIVAPSDMMDGR
ncbi:MAG: porphobilinogen synthase, partial [Pseudomonadota bacterium]